MKLPVIPPPTGFSEGQRMVFGCLVALAGIAHFAFAAVLVAILVNGDWGEDHFQQIIEILGYGLFLLLAIDAVVVISLSLGGPVGRLKLKAGKDGFEGEASGDDAPPLPFSPPSLPSPSFPSGGPPMPPTPPAPISPPSETRV